MSEGGQTRAVAAAPVQVTAAPAQRLQRTCDCGQHTNGEGECAECRKKQAGTLQRAATANGPNMAPPIVHEVLRASGQPLDAATRGAMEPRFGHDFSKVRVHTDDRAAESARAVNALAYTVGRDVVFNSGRYAPGTAGGRQLLTHELTHVVQQASDSGPVPETALRIDPSGSAEREAQTFAHRVLSAEKPGLSSSAEGVQLQRLPWSLQRGGQDQCSGAGATCASGDACLTPDREATGTATAWALAVNVDIERDSWESALYNQEFGHTYATFRENSGRQFTYGFYPAGELPNENKRQVPGCVHHPDRTHDQCIDNRINYSLTQAQYDSALAMAQKICKERHTYGATYTCTTFAADVAGAAGQTMPSSRSAKTTIFSQHVPEIDNPNTLNENINREKARDKQKKGFWNTADAPVIHLNPVPPIALNDDPETTIFNQDWIPTEGAVFRWRLYDADGRHYLMRGATSDNEILDWLSFTNNKTAIIGRKTRDLLKQRGVTKGVVECTLRFAVWPDQRVRLDVTFTD
jgi:hypothetical protein